MDLTKLWLLLAPPVAGGVIGYFTNDLAINMLFRPYQALYWAGRKLPFTPGLIPSNQARLAQRISDTIMGSLLTPEELQNLARRLLETERVQKAISWLLVLTLEQVREDKQQRTAAILANILRDLSGQSLPRLLKVWARRENFLEAQLNQILDQVLFDFQLDDVQSRRLVDWLFDRVWTVDLLRQELIDFLTDRNIQIIDEGFRGKVSGTYWVIANLVGLRNILVRLRTHALDERDTMNGQLKELLQALEVRERLTEWLQNFSLQNLPLSTVQQLRKTIQESVRQYIRDKGPDLLQRLNQSLDWDGIAHTILNRLTTSPVVGTSLDLVSYELALVLERYLERDLETIVEQAIPVLGIDQVIIERVNATSPRDLEAAIQGIVRSELQAIVNLGGILGFLIGVLQSTFLLIQGY